jgi:tight adherence protein B
MNMQHKWKWIISILILISIGWIYFANIVWALLPLILLRVVTNAWISIENENKKIIKLEQYQLFLDSTASFIQSGSGLEKSFHLCCNQIAQIYGNNHIVVKNLKKAIAQLTNGVPFTQVMTELFFLFDVEESQLSADAIRIMTLKGGDIGQFFIQLSALIRDKFITNQEVQLVRSQKRLEAIIVCIMPLVFFAFLKLSSPDFVAPLYTRSGHLIMSGSFIIWVFSIKIVHSVLSSRLH